MAPLSTFAGRRSARPPPAFCLCHSRGSLSAAGCAPAISTSTVGSNNTAPGAPVSDPRVGLRAGKYGAATAAWNLRLVPSTKPSEKFEGITNSDIAFTGPYAIQGNYNGYQVWDISNRARQL